MVAKSGSWGNMNYDKGMTWYDINYDKRLCGKTRVKRTTMTRMTTMTRISAPSDLIRQNWSQGDGRGIRILSNVSYDKGMTRV